MPRYPDAEELGNPKNQLAVAVSNEAYPAALSCKTPEAQDGLRVHSEGVVSPSLKIGRVFQGPHAQNCVGELIAARRELIE